MHSGGGGGKYQPPPGYATAYYCGRCSHRVYGRCKRHATDDHQQVAERQVENVDVGHVPHVLVPGEYRHERAVADGADDEYDGEERGHDVRLRSVRVVVGVVRGRHNRFAPVADVTVADVRRHGVVDGVSHTADGRPALASLPSVGGRRAHENRD